MQLAWVISWDSAPGCCVYQQPYPTTLVSVVSASCQGWPLSILFSSKPAHTLPLWAESSPIPFFYLSQQASHKVRGLPQPRACSCAYSLLYRFLLGGAGSIIMPFLLLLYLVTWSSFLQLWLYKRSFPSFQLVFRELFCIEMYFWCICRERWAPHPPTLQFCSSPCIS